MTISSVAPATPAVGSPAGASAGAGLGALFAGILGVGTASADPGASDSAPTSADSDEVDVLEQMISDGAGSEAGPVAGTAELLAAAQIMAAAQVVPVTPVLAAALGLSAAAPTVTGPAGVPTIAGPAGVPTIAGPAGIPTIAGPAGVPTGSTAVSAGDPVATVPSSAVPLAAPAVPGNEAATQPTQPAPAAPAAADATPAASGSAAVAETGSSASGAVTAQGSQADSSAGHHRPEPGARGQERAEPVTAPSAPQPTTSAVGTTVRTDAASAPTGPQATQQVTGQVFPEVTRLVSRGDGTQRITLKLSPEALGDVRVVLTVRDGDVQVRMVGSELAQQALRAGAPELQRLLDLAGATSSSIVVGDQGSATDAGLHSGPGSDRNPDHRTAGTRDGDTSARDGFPGGPQQRPSSDPTATRGGTSTDMAAPSGVDMTM